MVSLGWVSCDLFYYHLLRANLYSIGAMSIFNNKFIRWLGYIQQYLTGSGCNLKFANALESLQLKERRTRTFICTKWSHENCQVHPTNPECPDIHLCRRYRQYMDMVHLKYHLYNLAVSALCYFQVCFNIFRSFECEFSP